MPTCTNAERVLLDCVAAWVGHVREHGVDDAPCEVCDALGQRVVLAQELVEHETPTDS